ncbi:hypothetical protein OROMI_007873 [Orobanche minor]
MLSVDVRSGDFTLTPLPQDVHVLSNWHTFTVEGVLYISASYFNRLRVWAKHDEDWLLDLDVDCSDIYSLRYCSLEPLYVRRDSGEMAKFIRSTFGAGVLYLYNADNNTFFRRDLGVPVIRMFSYTDSFTSPSFDGIYWRSSAALPTTHNTQILRRERKAQAQKEKVAGNAAYMKNDFEIAIEHYSKAIELDDEDISFLTNRAAVYLEMEKYDDCIKECEKAVERGRELRLDEKMIASALKRKGTALVKMAKCSKDYEPAIETLREALCELINLSGHMSNPEVSDILKKLKDAEKAKRDLILERS